MSSPVEPPEGAPHDRPDAGTEGRSHEGRPSDDGLSEEAGGGSGAMSVLRRGLRATPVLRRGLMLTVGMAVSVAVGRIVVPVLIQQILDRGVTGPQGFQPAFILWASAVALLVVVVVAVGARFTYLRLVITAEDVLRRLRVQAFERVHQLSVADHDETRRGTLTSRVTSDVETIARFAQWGGVAWIVDTVVIVGVVAVMFAYSWQLALVTVAVFAPMLPILRALQRRQLRAYDAVRTRVGETLSEVSESVMGASVIRAYGTEAATRRRLHGAIGRQYRAERRAARYFSMMFPLGDSFGGAALALVVVIGAWWGPGWGLELGTLVAFLFLVALLQGPIAELAEILDQTQTALAGWRKVLDVLDMDPDVVEPTSGVALPSGPVEVRAEAMSFVYRGTTRPALADVDVTIPAGAAVAVVGETGSGKTTFAKLLCRLSDPTSGRIVVAGTDLREVAPESRRAAIRMVPQDGFLFDTTVQNNVLMGAPAEELPLSAPARNNIVRRAFESLGLSDWVERLPEGLETKVGERGSRLSVGERQLVALTRVQLANPGLLVLDEATSSVDPETERALATALAHLTRGRTTVTIAHRLATAESADFVLVFDGGNLVQRGTHAELLSQPGRYHDLHDSWLGAIRSA